MLPGELAPAFLPRRSTHERGLDEAHRPLERLPAVGVDQDDVVEALEAEAVQKFADSLSELLAGLEATPSR